MADISVLFGANMRDIVAMMRRLADQIEAGEVDASSAVCVLHGSDGEIHVFGWGDKAEDCHALGMLEAAKFQIVRG